MLYSAAVIFILAGICVEESFGQPSAPGDDSKPDVTLYLSDYYPKIPKVRIEDKFNCSGIFLDSRTVLTDIQCGSNDIHRNTYVEVRRALNHGKDAVYRVTGYKSVTCSFESPVGCGVKLLLLEKSAEGALAVNIAESKATPPQKDEPLTLISWSPNAYVNGVQIGLLRNVALKVEMSGAECAEKLRMTLQDNDLICASVTSQTKLPRKILGGSLVNRNGTVVGIVSLTKSLDNGEVLVVSTALATQRESIDSLRHRV